MIGNTSEEFNFRLTGLGVNLIVRLGDWDTQTSIETEDHIDIPVGEIIFHPRYYRSVLWNDIALLILTEKVPVMPHVSPICLPSPDFTQDQYSGCVATGWGKSSFGKYLPLVGWKDIAPLTLLTRFRRCYM